MQEAFGKSGMIHFFHEWDTSELETRLPCHPQWCSRAPSSAHTYGHMSNSLRFGSKASLVFRCVSLVYKCKPKKMAAARQTQLGVAVKTGLRENHLEGWSGAPGSQTAWKKKWLEVIYKAFGSGKKPG